MKKSHRKDVIIARIVFAVICLILIGMIVGAVMLVRSHRASNATPDSQTEVRDTQNIQESQKEEDTQVEATENTEENPVVEPNPIMQTISGVNLRSEPNTSCQVITVLAQGTQLELLGVENGWAIVDYQGQTGYVSMDYLEEVIVTVVE